MSLVFDGKLSAGAAQAMPAGLQPVDPVVQVVYIRRLESKGGAEAKERWRVQVSDGVSTTFALLATQLNPRIAGGEIQELSVIRVKSHVCNDVSNKRLLILLDFDHLTKPDGNPVDYRIGNPSGVESGVTAATAAPSAAGGYVARTPAPYAPPTAQVLPAGVTPSQIVSIAALSPYNNGWVIKARITSKGQVRTFNKNNREGKLMALDLLDADGKEIRATLWNDAVTMYEHTLNVGDVCFFGRGRVQPANKRFAGSIQNDYELSLDSNSLIEKAPGDDARIANIHYSVVSIGALPELPVGDVVDLIAVFIRDEQPTRVNTKNGETTKRLLIVADNSGSSVELTLWGKPAEDFQGRPDEVLGIKGCRISEWNGRSLSASGSSHIEWNPDLPAAHQLASWWLAVGRNSQLISVSTNERRGGAGFGADRPAYAPDASKHFSELPTELAHEQKEQFVNRATVIFIRYEPTQNFCYPACTGCKRKVLDKGDSKTCTNCNTDPADFAYKYTLQFHLADHTGDLWATGFDEAGGPIMGRPASELMQMRLDGREAELKAIFKAAQFRTFNFRFRMKSETWGQDNKTRLRTDVISAPTPVDFVAESRSLLDKIAVALRG